METKEERKTGALPILSLIFGIIAFVSALATIFGGSITIGIICAVASIVIGIVAICLKKKALLSVIGIILSAITIIVGGLICIGIMVFNAAGNAINAAGDAINSSIANDIASNYSNILTNDYLNIGTDSTEALTTELELEKVSISYDASKWKRDILQEEDNTKVLTGGYGEISLTYQTSDYYFTTSQIVEELEKHYEELGYTIISDGEITINGEEWTRIVCSGADFAGVQLVLVDGYTVYSLQYETSSAIYYAVEYMDVEKVYMTLKIDSTEDEIAETEAKSKLIGEWDWGKQGYFVIEEDKAYLYKDSTKDMNNVFYGNYEADNKIKTYAAGYAEGMYLVMTIEKFYQDGNELTSASTTQFDYAFSPNSDGTYTIKNLYTGATGTATKVK